MKFKFLTRVAIACCVSGNVWALSDARPDYQKEYDAYLHDLQIIEQQGYAPKNPILEDDLAKMSSERRIRLTHPSIASARKKSSKHLKVAENAENTQAAKNDAEVVGRVEIIRVPEEFREKYADVYAEETQRVSAHKLVKQQEEDRQKALENEEALKIAEHDNPFRLLKEKKLETNVSSLKNKKSGSLADAYFNQQKRAFVTDKTIVVEKKEKAKAQESSDKVVANGVAESNKAAREQREVKNSSRSRVCRSGAGKSQSDSSSAMGRGSRVTNMFLE